MNIINMTLKLAGTSLEEQINKHIPKYLKVNNNTEMKELIDDVRNIV